MRFLIIILLFLLVSCKNDDCEPNVDSSNSYPKLIEVDYFSFRQNGLQGDDCDLIIITTVDSFATLDRYVLDSIPVNINTDPSFAYKGILKVVEGITTCRDVRSDPETIEDYQYVQILYWQLL